MSVKYLVVGLLCLTLLVAVPKLSAQISSNDYYGSGIAFDSLGNLRVSPVGYPMVSYRFRANHSGSLQTVWPYLITALSPPGYASGTGGTLVLQVRTDDGTINHFPTSTILASVSLPNALNKPAFSPFTFSSPPSLSQGTIYHLVWSNSDGNPSQNYVSLDLVDGLTGPVPPQPTIRPEDWGAIAFDGTKWFDLANADGGQSFTPIANLIYGDAFTQGLGYIDDLTSERHTISGSSAVRETFVVSGGSRTVVRVSVRARRTAGSDPLRVQFFDGSGNTVNDCYVSASSFSTNVDTFVTCPFTSSYVLTSGSTYNLDLEATSTSTYDTYSIQNAAKDSWNFGANTTFRDGHAEYKINGGSWTPWGGSRLDTDLQFYFTLQ